MQEESGKHYCQHCFKEIENEKFPCPACGLPYHSECWEKNYGCAVISCSQKNILLNPLYQSSIPVREILIQIEYLINLKKYDEAFEECNRILHIDKKNTDAKIFFNKTKTIIDSKRKILSDAENSYKKSEYKAAAYFYKQYINYCSEDEKEIITAKIKYLTELLPHYKRKRILLNSIIGVIIFIILCIASYLFYYNVVLKEDREYAAIERNDNFDDAKEMELQINEYESFISRFPEGKYRNSALSKIAALSLMIADNIYKEDWRLAFKFLKKVNFDENQIAYSRIYKNIYTLAEKEYNDNLKTAKKHNKEKNYPDSKNFIEKNIIIADYFPEKEIFSYKGKLINSKNLLTKKISYDVKAKNLEKEINENSALLKSISPDIDIDDIVNISGKIIKKIKDDYILKSLATGKLYLIRTTNNFAIGEEVILECISEGKKKIPDESDNELIIPVYSEVINNSKENGSRELILQRIKYLKEQKSKADSVLNLPL